MDRATQMTVAGRCFFFFSTYSILIIILLPYHIIFAYC